MSAKSILIRAHRSTMPDQVKCVFTELELGRISHVDFDEEVYNGKTYHKFLVHFSSTKQDDYTTKFFSRLNDVTPCRVVYANIKDTQLCWDAYYTPAPVIKYSFKFYNDSNSINMYVSRT